MDSIQFQQLGPPPKAKNSAQRHSSSWMVLGPGLEEGCWQTTPSLPQLGSHLDSATIIRRLLGTKRHDTKRKMIPDIQAKRPGPSSTSPCPRSPHFLAIAMAVFLLSPVTILAKPPLRNPRRQNTVSFSVTPLCYKIEYKLHALCRAWNLGTGLI